LDDAAWSDAPWTDGIVDITKHIDSFENMVPDVMQMQAKMRWDEDFFYIGAKLNEPYVNATIVGHNIRPPYHDNDFETFIDPHGSGEYYVEYEMNVLNSTYDIKWGKPDGTAAQCTHNGSQWDRFPTCVNTSFSGYAGGHGEERRGVWHTHTPQNHERTRRADPLLSLFPSLSLSLPRSLATQGNWSMVNDNASALPRADGGPSRTRGMQSATAWSDGAFGRPTFPYTVWTLEIAFPLKRYDDRVAHAADGGWHGGLLDADPVVQSLFDASDPNRGDAGPGRPRYWRVDVSRAEHPFNFTFADGTWEVCPFNCTAELATKDVVAVTRPTISEVKARWPTILGSYWEWVWGPVGKARPGVGYMHRPSQWPLVQFAPSGGAPSCRSIEFPARHVAFSLGRAQRKYAALHSGAFASTFSELLAAANAPSSTICVTDRSTSDTCDLAALNLVAQKPSVFAVAIIVTDDAKVLTRECTQRPCYAATVTVTVPQNAAAHAAAAAPYVYSVTTNENRRITAKHPTLRGSATAPCL